MTWNYLTYFIYIYFAYMFIIKGLMFKERKIVLILRVPTREESTSSFLNNDSFCTVLCHAEKANLRSPSVDRANYNFHRRNASSVEIASVPQRVFIWNGKGKAVIFQRQGNICTVTVSGVSILWERCLIPWQKIFSFFPIWKLNKA